MNAIVQLNAVLQVMAAFLVYVVSYLAAAILVISTLVLAELIADRNNIAQDYGARRIPDDAQGWPKASIPLPRSRNLVRQPMTKSIL